MDRPTPPYGSREIRGTEDAEVKVRRDKREDGVRGALVTGASAMEKRPQQDRMPIDPATKRKICVDHVYAEEGCMRWGCPYAHAENMCGRGKAGGRKTVGGEGEEFDATRIARQDITTDDPGQHTRYVGPQCLPGILVLSPDISTPRARISQTHEPRMRA